MYPRFKNAIVKLVWNCFVRSVESVEPQPMASQHGEENKYKVGDYVYIEQSQSDPLVIRRIDELQKTAQGNVAAKVVSFYARILINIFNFISD